MFHTVLMDQFQTADNNTMYIHTYIVKPSIVQGVCYKNQKFKVGFRSIYLQCTRFKVLLAHFN